MTVFEMFLSIWLFLYRLKRKVRDLTESDFNRMLYSDDLTYEQKIYLIYFRYA